MSDQDGRVVPYDLEAEESLLGAMLLGRGPINAALETGVTAGDFFSPEHGDVFEAITKLHAQVEPADPVTVADEMSRAGATGDLSKPRALVSLQVHCPASSSAGRYAHIVLGHAQMRRLHAVAGQIADLAGGRPEDPAQAIEQAARLVSQVAPKTTTGSQRSRRVRPGGDAILDNGAELVALWGEAGSPLWSSGEGLFVVGPTGVGKTTLCQRLVLARLGIVDATLLTLPVEVDVRPFLYLAADRPRQAKRSMRRMVSEDQRDLLNERLIFWEGPLPFSLVDEPWRLAAMIQEHGCAGVLVDSLKDLAVKLATDEVGGLVNMAFQECLAAGLELIVCHHQRKATAENRRPQSLDDVYGSTWLVAGAGSVVILWGTAGDPIIDLHHLKQPAEEVGPLELRLDHTTGTVEVVDGEPDLYVVLQAAARGLSASGAARILFHAANPDRNEVEKVRRKLDRLVERNVAHKKGGDRDGSGRRTEVLYFAVERAREAP